MRALRALVLACGIGIAVPAAAQIGSERYAAIVVDARSGNALIAANPDERRYPASLTKMMTAYMAFEALRDRQVQLSTPVPVSYSAAAMAPSKLGLAPGMSLTVEEAILALVTKSANDAAAALGELLGGGSEDRFAQMMTLRARSLGMRNTTFRNASGLPDLDQVSTARDMALLGQRLLRDFPDRYAFFSTPHFVFRGRTHWNHNRLLNEYDGADGIKTGYVNDSGFNLVASAQREGVRLVAAVFGGRTGRERDRHMMALLDQGFATVGVAPRDPPVVARRALPGVMASATAAPLGRAGRHAGRPVVAAGRAAPAPKASAFRTARSKPGLLRMTSTTKSSKPVVRVEQGDTSRNSAPPKQARGFGKAAAEKPAAKPAKTAATGRRAG
ncbi:D-alanyl-D-alanine carboxypeptidase family protein [Dankookia sp. GCM10030260]|uniref:D-alanyl-D-alanine carboxypeptidase family protein n=1 Tax=Dankookia sp. GCM10030260 TaxID=3273390 RepID=UPI0036157FBF